MTMEIIDFPNYENKKYDLLTKIKKGCIFIYPTDTIYGLGAIATDELIVSKIRQIKKRTIRPFSIVVPSFSWIFDNCELNDYAKSKLNLLPKPYTLILKKKENCNIAKNVSFDETIGIRIPNHFISDLVSLIDIPIITTSVNISGDELMTSLEDLNDDVKKYVDFMINVGELKNKPSKLINLDE